MPDILLLCRLALALPLAAAAHGHGGPCALHDEAEQLLRGHVVACGDIDEDALMETALEAGAEDMITHDDSYEIQTTPENYTAVHGALTDAGYEMVDSDVEFVPSMESAPKDAHDLKQLKKMIDILEDNDDVQKVHHNCSVDLEEVE